jgi:hypothetical protein
VENLLSPPPGSVTPPFYAALLAAVEGERNENCRSDGV